MDYKYKLSIIIPVYNVEKYIAACLDSVVYQKGVNYDEYEVIVVNDGSPDNSLDIAEKYAAKYSNIRIISRDNGGLSAARNTGLEQASGEYIWFVDSDDYISSDSVSLILEKANGVDMINIAYQEVVDGELSKICNPKNVKTGHELLTAGIAVPAQFHVYKNNLLRSKNLKFIEGILHEDMEFTPRVCFLSKTIDSINCPLYFYRIRSGSIMTTIKPKRAFDYLTVASSLIDFSFKQGISLKDTPLLNTICMSINNALYIINQAGNDNQKVWLKKYEDNIYFNVALTNSSIMKYRLEGYLFKYLPINKIKIYKLLQKLR